VSETKKATEGAASPQVAKPKLDKLQQNIHDIVLSIISQLPQGGNADQSEMQELVTKAQEEIFKNLELFSQRITAQEQSTQAIAESQQSIAAAVAQYNNLYNSLIEKLEDAGDPTNQMIQAVIQVVESKIEGLSLAAIEERLQALEESKEKLKKVSKAIVEAQDKQAGDVEAQGQKLALTIKTVIELEKLIEEKIETLTVKMDALTAKGMTPQAPGPDIELRDKVDQLYNGMVKINKNIGIIIKRQDQMEEESSGTLTRITCIASISTAILLIADIIIRLLF